MEAERRRGLALFYWGGVLYGLVEIIWRGETHWTMLLTGGACFWLLDRLDGVSGRDPLALRCCKGALLITAAELAAGLFFNRLLRLDVWDYSGRPFNLLGQVCPLYTLYWYFLCYPAFGILRLTRPGTGKSTKNPPQKGIANGRQTVYNRDKTCQDTQPGDLPG